MLAGARTRDRVLNPKTGRSLGESLGSIPDAKEAAWSQASWAMTESTLEALEA
jgi:hypothetical protein